MAHGLQKALRTMSPGGSRPLAFRLLRALAGLVACTSIAAAPACTSEGDGAGETDDELANVPTTAVKKQLIGTCWLYATSSWAESLAKAATPRGHFDFSESYWSYWFWFDEITDPNPRETYPFIPADNVGLYEGGDFGVALEIIGHYGLMREGDFIREDARRSSSRRQAAAYEAMDQALKTGVLRTPEARRDARLVRAELNRAFRLEPNVVALLDETFGPGKPRRFDDRADAARAPEGAPIIRAADLPARMRSARGETVVRPLLDAIGTRGGDGADYQVRAGEFAWSIALYPWAKPDGSLSPAQLATERRSYLRRVQRTLHAGMPVPITWWADLMDEAGRFQEAPHGDDPDAEGHMTLVTDYEVDEVPGFGTLPAGVVETRPAALDAALSDLAKIRFFRVKNSWGYDGSAVRSGYNDLYMTYLEGTAKDQPGNGGKLGGRGGLCNDPTRPFCEVFIPNAISGQP